jgi:hypothetical protein
MDRVTRPSLAPLTGVQIARRALVDAPFPPVSRTVPGKTWAGVLIDRHIPGNGESGRVPRGFSVDEVETYAHLDITDLSDLDLA